MFFPLKGTGDIMKKNITILFGLLLVLIGCVSAPSADDSLSNWLPSRGSTDFLPYVNGIGSVTLFKINDLQITVSTSGSKGSLRKDDEEIAARITQYQAVLAKKPNDYETCIMLAGLYADRGYAGDANEAIKYCNMALALDNNNSHALFTRSIGYLNNNEFNKAIDDLNALMKINLQSVKGAYYLMGIIYCREEEQLRKSNNFTEAALKLDAAIEAFQNVELFDPNFAGINEFIHELLKRKNTK